MLIDVAALHADATPRMRAAAEALDAWSASRLKFGQSIIGTGGGDVSRA
jgi:hypothetical protein